MRGLFAALVLVLLASAVYVDRLDGPLVFDDAAGIEQNESIREWSTAFRPPADTPVAARPIPNLTLALNYALSGSEPASYHRFNLGLHCAVTVLVFFVLARLFSRGKFEEMVRLHSGGIAFAAAALWAVHPATVEVVLYAVQRTESCMALFYLLSIYAVVRSVDAERPRSWYTLAWVGCVAALMSKEVAVTLPVMALLLDRAFFAGSFRAAWSRRKMLWIGFAVCWAALALLQIGSARSGSVGATNLAYLAAQTEIVPDYLAAIFVPGRHVLDYGMLVRGASYGSWLTWLTTGTLVIGCVFLTFTHPRVGFVGAWFFGILAPSSSLVTVYTEIGAERRIYLPMVAVIAALVLAAHAVIVRLPLRGLPKRVYGILFGAPLLVAVFFLGAESRALTEAFATDRAFWEHAVRQRPQNPRAHYNLGEAYRRAGELEAAAVAYRNAVERHPHYRMALTNLGGALVKLGEYEEAVEVLTRAVEVGPDRFNARYNLAIVLMLQRDFEQAAVHFEAATRIRPDHAGARERLAAVREVLGTQR